MTKQSTRFNIVSETADGVGFAVRLQDEGEDVRVWIRAPEAKSVGDGLVNKVGDLEDLYHDADPNTDVFVFDCSGNGLVADFFAGQGFAVLGGSILADRLERDRDYGYQVMEESGIVVPETVSFDSFAAGVKHVEKHPDVRWVYKPSKQLGDLSPSHVSYDAEDLVEMLQNIERDVDIANPQFELQAFEPGVALSTELWFQHGVLVPELCNHTLERKELMNGDIGPSGGCLGNIVWMCGDADCPACQTALLLEPWARQERYHGMLDLNVIVAEQDGEIYGLEFTPRFGYDAAPTFLWQLVDSNLGEFLSSIARGQLREVETRDGFAAGLRVTLPPWPSERYAAEENVPIRGLDADYRDDMFLYNVKAGPNGPDDLRSAGAWGIVGLFTSHGASPDRALSKPLAAAKDLRLKNKQFRTDLGKRFREDLDKLGVTMPTTATVVSSTRR